MADAHRWLVARSFLKGLDSAVFAVEAADIIGVVNDVDPVRDGNGRTHMLYLVSLARQAGHALDLAAIEATSGMAASQAVHSATYGPMARCISSAIRPSGSPTIRPE